MLDPIKTNNMAQKQDFLNGRKAITFLDLFAGAGGISEGFLQSYTQDKYYDFVLASDINSNCELTHRVRYNRQLGLKTDFLLEDIMSDTFLEDLKQTVGKKRIDLIIAGPPCQGFSLTGPRNFDDTRNRLYLAVFKAVKMFDPKAFVIENVTGMETLYGGQIKKEIIRRFNALGYNVECKVLCAADYGVPQMRKRLVFVGIKPEYGEFVFPEPIVDPEHYITCREAIDDLPNSKLDKFSKM